MKRTGAKILMAACASCALISGVAEGQSTWIGPSGSTSSPTTGSWNTSGNWSPSGVPTSSASRILTFGGSGTASYTSTRNSSFTSTFEVGTFILNSSSSATNTIASSGEVFNDNDDNEHLTISQNGSGAFIISANFDVGLAELRLQGDGTGRVTMSGDLDDKNTGNDDLMRIVKSGSSTFALTNTSNGYTNGTSISGGLLLVNNTSGSGTGTGSVNVLSGGALGGTGFIAGSSSAGVTVASGGTVTGGALSGSGLTSVGKLTLSDDLTLSSGATFQVDIGGTGTGIGTAGVHFDQIVLSGNGDTFVTGGANLVVKIRDGAVASTYRIVDTTNDDVIADVPFAGLAHNVEYSVPNSQLKYKVLYDESAGHIDLVIIVVPEPASGLMVLCGALGLMRRRRNIR